MCLYNVREVGKAKEDIVCYKVLLYATDIFKEPKYITPFEEIEVPYACIHARVPFMAVHKYWETPVTTPAELKLRGQVGSGFIHTYRSMDDIREEATFYSWLNSRSGGHVAIFKCIIPKDTLYCRGSGDSDRVSVYASKKIVFEEQVPLPDYLKEYRNF